MRKLASICEVYINIIIIREKSNKYKYVLLIDKFDLLLHAIYSIFK